MEGLLPSLYHASSVKICGALRISIWSFYCYAACAKHLENSVQCIISLRIQLVDVFIRGRQKRVKEHLDARVVIHTDVASLSP